MGEAQPDQDYPILRAWGRMMGSDQQFIEMECRTAERDGVPQDAYMFRTRERFDGSDRDGRRNFFPDASTRVWYLWDAKIPATTRENIILSAQYLGLDMEAFTALIDKAEASAP